MKKILTSAKNACRNAIYTAKEKFLWGRRYAGLREPKEKLTSPFKSEDYPRIVDSLKENGFDVRKFSIDIAGFKEYLRKAEYNRYPVYYSAGKHSGFVEKTLEHYLAATLLELSERDIYIDIANAGSPTPEIYRALFKCETFRQDLIYSPGMSGNVIGGDACDMPLEDEFATKMALHCSFEHFEQDSDIRFVGEAARVLKPGGRVCILPLYLATRYSILTDPVVLPKKGIPFESDAVLHCLRGYRNRHGRFYDVPHLIKRVRENLNGLNLTIYVVENEREVDPSCYVKFIGLFEKKYNMK